MTVGGNTLPMGFNQFGELPVRFQTLPFQAVFPALEEGTSATLGTVVPELSEGFLEDVGRVQASVGLEQFSQGAPPIQAQVLATREQGIALALDVAPVLVTEAFVLTAPDLIEGLGEMAQNMKFIEDDPGIWGVLHHRVSEGFPHIHGSQFDAGALFLAQRLEKQVDVGLFAALTTDPDRTSAVQVTDDDPVVMPFADGDLINADGPGCGQSRQVNLLLHVALIEIFHRAVVQAFHLGNGLVRHVPAQLAHLQGKALGIAGVLCQPVKVFYMHAAAPRAVDTPAFERQVDAPAGNREIPDPQDLLVVTPPAAVTTVRTDGCFFRRLSVMTRTYRSPNTPFNWEAATKPGNANRARIDLGFFMLIAYPKNGSIFIA